MLSFSFWCINFYFRYSEYMFPHCHEEECLKLSYQQYDEFVNKDTPKTNYKCAYEEYMYPVDDVGSVATVVFPPTKTDMVPDTPPPTYECAVRNLNEYDHPDNPYAHEA